MVETKKKISRIVTLDLLRGYFLVAIIIDHLNFFPNGLDWWSARGGLFVTTAEGFFLISGIVLGIVRGRKLINEPFKNVASLLLKRALQLYITMIVLVLLFTFIASTFFMGQEGLKPGVAPAGTDIVSLIWQTLTFQYFYGWADYLRFYAIFMLVCPLAIWLLRKGKWYILVVLSLLVWAQFPDVAGLSAEEQERLQPISWQLLFFGGLILGFYWDQMAKWWSHLAKNLRLFIGLLVLGFAVITLTYNSLLMIHSHDTELSHLAIDAQVQSELYVSYFDKERLPLTRVGLFLAWFCLFYYVFKRFEKQITKWLGWLLLSFGTNSLYVYTLHAVAIFFVDLFLNGGDILFNFLVSMAIILGIRLLIHFRFMMNIIPR